MNRKYQIFVQAFKWPEYSVGSDFFKVSFLNKENTPSSISPRLDITPYLQFGDGLSAISYSFEEIENDNDVYKRFFSSSNFSFKVSDLIEYEPGKTLRKFFMVDQDTSYIKFKVEVYHDNSVLFMGVIGQDGISEPVSVGEDSHLIEVVVTGFEKEAKDYYSNIPLREFMNIPGWTNTEYQVTVHGENNQNPVHIRKMTLSTFLTYIFDANFSVDYSSFLANYRIVERPHLVKFSPGGSTANSKTIWYKSGYDRAQRMGESVWGLVTKIFNAMGWVFYIIPGQGNVLKFIVKNRSDLGLELLYANESNISANEGFRIYKSSPVGRPRYIVIKDGTMFGGDNDYGFLFGNKAMRGARCYVLSNGYGKSLSSNQFQEMSIHQGVYNPIFHTFSQIHYESEDRFEWWIGNSMSGNPLVLNTTNYGKSKNEILFIDAGGENVSGWQVNPETKHNRDNGDEQYVGDKDMVFTGNYGNMISSQGTVPSGQPYYFYPVNYQEYVKSEKFKQNFMTLLAGKSNMNIEVGLNYLIKNPLFTLNFNYPGFASSKFSPSGIEIDLQTETSFVRGYA